MIDKVHHGKLKVRAARTRKYHLIDVASYKAEQVDKQFEASINAHPEVLDRLVQEVMEDIRAGRTEDLNPDTLEDGEIKD